MEPTKDQLCQELTTDPFVSQGSFLKREVLVPAEREAYTRSETGGGLDSRPDEGMEALAFCHCPASPEEPFG